MVPERTQARANPARGIALIATAVIVGIFLLRNGNFDLGSASADVADDVADQVADDQASGGGDSQATDTTQPARPPGEITVRVANTTSIGGAARGWSDDLAEAGYAMAEPTDAPAGVAGGDGSVTVILYAAGFDREAANLATQLGAPPQSIAPLAEPPQIDPGGANLVVALGTDLARPPD